MVEIGQTAPDFEAPTSTGTPLRLSWLRGHPVILYFYPEADTPGCTVESKGFRDIYPELQKHHIAVVGVSVDSVEKQQAFCTKYNLPFPLVADTSKKVATEYGVLNPRGRASRVTFFVDPNGVVKEKVDSRAADDHVARAQQMYLASS